jgi:hypothetical protein
VTNNFSNNRTLLFEEPEPNFYSQGKEKIELNDCLTALQHLTQLTCYRLTQLIRYRLHHRKARPKPTLSEPELGPTFRVLLRFTLLATCR